MAGKFPFWRYLVKFEGCSVDDAKAIASEQQTNLGNPYDFQDGGA